jgi:antitoxin ParD1/3/4
MASTKAISVELSPGQRAILERQLESGRYQTASEVVGDALRLMADRDAVFDSWLREEVRASMADTQPPAPIDAVFRRLEARHARRVKATKRGS